MDIQQKWKQRSNRKVNIKTFPAPEEQTSSVFPKHLFHILHGIKRKSLMKIMEYQF